MACDCNIPLLYSLVFMGTSKLLTRKLLCTHAIAHLCYTYLRECSDLVVECLSRDREVTGSSLTVVTALCP